MFLDVPMDQFFSRADVELPGAPARERRRARPGRPVAGSARCSPAPSGRCWSSARTCGPTAPRTRRCRLAETAGVPVITNGMGRGVLPAGHPLLVTRARSEAFGRADLVVVVGTPLDFRLGYGVFGGKDGRRAAAVVHLADSPGQLAGHVELAASAAGDLSLVLDGVLEGVGGQPAARRRTTAGRPGCRTRRAPPSTRTATLLASDADPIHPARIYGELDRRLADDAVVIGDGGDFVSFAGKYVEPKAPGGWLDPGPYGCLGTGLGYAIAARLARPSAARWCCCSATARPASR